MKFFEETITEKKILRAKGIREYREKNKISLRKLAEKIGISYTHLHNIELNKIRATESVALKIENALISN